MSEHDPVIAKNFRRERFGACGLLFLALYFGSILTEPVAGARFNPFGHDVMPELLEPGDSLVFDSSLDVDESAPEQLRDHPERQRLSGLLQGRDAVSLGFGVRALAALDGHPERSWKVLAQSIEWPGMRMDIDYADLAAVVRRRMGGGVPALAALGLLLLVTRRW